MVRLLAVLRHIDARDFVRERNAERSEGPQYGENGRRFADERLSLKALIPRYEKLLQDVIEAGSK